MDDHKNFYKGKKKTYFKIPKQDIIKDEEGFVHVAMSSTIFHDVGTSLLASNSMYANLLADIMPSVEPYSPKEKIVIDVYETVDSDDFTRTLTENGFRKYVNSLLSRLLRQHISRFFLFFVFLLIGIGIEIVLYGFLPYDSFQPYWLFKSVEVLASLFIWQFGGYLAFEFLGEIKSINRYKQIANIKFNYKHWD